MSELRVKQHAFAVDLARLILWVEVGLIPAAIVAGEHVEITLGDVYEDQTEIQDPVKNPHPRRPASCWIHRPGSCHSLRLAADINLFVDGDYIEGRHRYFEQMARQWLGLNPLNAWGGNWGDYNHFSRPHGGMR